MLIAIASFTSTDKNVPFLQTKQLLKEALVSLCGTGNTPVLKRADAGETRKDSEEKQESHSELLKSMIAHNLACVNYAELLAYQERGGADFLAETSLVEQVNRTEREQQES